MSVNLQVGGVPGNPTTATLALAEGDVFAPSSSGSPIINVVGFSICNTDGSARNVELYWNDGTTSYQFFQRSIPANESYVLADILIPLQPGATSGTGVAKKIRGLAAAADVVLVTPHYTTVTPQITR